MRVLRLLAVSVTAALVALAGNAVPAFAAPGTVASLTFAPNVINGGDSATGSVTLAAAASDDTVVTLTNFAPGLLIAPTSVTVPAGALATSFTVTARPLQSGGDFACLQVAPSGVSGCLFVNPVGGPRLNEVAFNPTMVAGGSPVTGTVRFATRTAGVIVSLTSSNPAAASVPAQVTVPNGATSATFSVTTGTVTTATAVTVTATAGSMRISGTLNVTPRPGGPGSDTVRITRAEWNRGLLRIEATSTNPNAVLTVFFASSPDFPEFNLTNNGGGRYSIQRSWLDNPLPIIVRSNFGGSAHS